MPKKERESDRGPSTEMETNEISTAMCMMVSLAMETRFIATGVPAGGVTNEDRRAAIQLIIHKAREASVNPDEISARELLVETSAWVMRHLDVELSTTSSEPSSQ